MGRVYRLKGAIVAQSGNDFFLVGNTKEPCDFAAHGFETPVEIDALKRPFVRLSRSGSEVKLAGAFLGMDLEGEDLARALADRFLIARNGSVSERLWRLVVADGDVNAEPKAEGEVDARWLGAIPQAVWQTVRETVLRCV
jgi:hypothetical protein